MDSDSGRIVEIKTGLENLQKWMELPEVHKTIPEFERHSVERAILLLEGILIGRDSRDI